MSALSHYLPNNGSIGFEKLSPLVDEWFDDCTNECWPVAKRWTPIPIHRASNVQCQCKYPLSIVHHSASHETFWKPLVPFSKSSILNFLGQMKRNLSTQISFHLSQKVQNWRLGKWHKRFSKSFVTCWMVNNGQWILALALDIGGSMYWYWCPSFCHWSTLICAVVKPFINKWRKFFKTYWAIIWQIMAQGGHKKRNFCWYLL